jgi:hypothetical protein
MIRTIDYLTIPVQFQSARAKMNSYDSLIYVKII